MEVINKIIRRENNWVHILGIIGIAEISVGLFTLITLDSLFLTVTNYALGWTILISSTFMYLEEEVEE